MKKTLLSVALLSSLLCWGSEAPADNCHNHIITNLDEFATEWAHAAFTDLNQEELQLLGAFLYYDVTSSQYELALRNFLLDLQRGSQILAFKLMNLDNIEQAYELSTKLSKLLEMIEKEVAPSRNYFLACWQECNKEIEQSDHQNLKLAIEQLQLLGQRSLNNWSKANKEEILKLLEKNSNTLDEAMNKMITCKNALDELVDETFPLAQDTEFIEIQTVHNALGISHVLYEAMFRASLATDEVMGVSFGLINLNAIIFSALYQAFYNELEEKNMLPMPLVINNEGLIPADVRSEVLPQFLLNNNQA
jgi:hypothetical protein